MSAFKTPTREGYTPHTDMKSQKESNQRSKNRRRNPTTSNERKKQDPGCSVRSSEKSWIFNLFKVHKDIHYTGGNSDPQVHPVPSTRGKGRHNRE